MSTRVIQVEPKRVTEKTALLTKSSISSIASSLHSVSSLSELNVLSSLASFTISRKDKRICCNFSRRYEVHDGEKREIIFTAYQENGICSSANEEYEDMVVYDLLGQVMFSIEFEEISGYLTKQMKFSVSTKIGLGTVSRICHFTDSPRYEIESWSGEHLYSIGPPKTSGIRSYNFKIYYDVLSNEDKKIASLVQEGRVVTLKFDNHQFSLRDKTLIISLGFILVIQNFTMPQCKLIDIKLYGIFKCLWKIYTNDICYFQDLLRNEDI